MCRNHDIKMTGTVHTVIEKINNHIYYPYLVIPEFVEQTLNDYIPAGYKAAKAIDLYGCKPVMDFCAPQELERVAGARVLKRQVEWFCGRVVLKDLLLTVMLPGSDYRDIVIGYDFSGRPCIRNYEDIAVSVTHSGNIAMAALHTVPGKRIGIDVEITSGIDIKAVLSVAFSPEEQLFYSNKSVKEIISAFTMKEAYLKITGRGFNEVITRVQIRGKKIFFNSAEIDGIEAVTGDIGEDYIFSLLYNL